MARRHPARASFLIDAIVLLAACAPSIPAADDSGAAADAAPRDTRASDRASPGDAAGAMDHLALDSTRDVVSCVGCSRPRIDSVTPDQSGASADTAVAIAGVDFRPGARVSVGDVEVASPEVRSATAIVAHFPPIDLRECGAKAVRVTNPDGAWDELLAGFNYLFDEDPILFVHGYLWQASDFDDFRSYFVGLGYPAEMLDAIQYSDNTGSNVVNARDELPPFVDAMLARTGRSMVDIVAHSMGGLSTRLYIKAYGGNSKVRDYVSLASPHHGSAGSCYVSGTGSDEQCPHYASQAESVNSVQWDLNGDPDSADIDETPFCAASGGDIFYHAIRYSGDIIITPHDVSCLDQQSRGDCSDPVNLEISYGDSHTGLLHNVQVHALVAGLVRAHNLSRPR